MLEVDLGLILAIILAILVRTVSPTKWRLSVAVGLAVFAAVVVAERLWTFVIGWGLSIARLSI